MDISKIIPLNKKLIVKPYEGAKQTAAGFVISQTNDSRVPQAGTVMKAAEDSTWKVGDVVFFRRFGADEMKFQTDAGEIKVYLVGDDEILARYSESLPE